MDATRPHTKQYEESARVRLGKAIARGREAAGHQWRPSFAEEAHISVRSLVKLEQGKPVGPQVYEAVARALPGWSEDTPQEILEGGPIPASPEPAEPRKPVKEFPIEEGVVFTVTRQDQERWRRMTREEIAEEAAMLGRTIGLRAQEAYLRAAIDARDGRLDGDGA
ncbi:hypothetical protein F9C11_21505 [Amycolatopsis sp. VS8301801F10]|uniref:hypothetical protein n=1 Tax=Amycolatopsis sp. VS8301801F10 TaxID=2652442 RepID=UPI0038FC22FC